MIEIPRTIRFSRKDIANYSYFHSELTKDIISSNKELANKIVQNDDWNTAKTIAGIRDAADEISKYQIEAAENITKSIASNTDRNIANRDHNTDKNIENRDYNTDKIINSLDELKGVFDWKLSELIWVQEKQIGYLQAILATLVSPRLTRANELREDGLRKYNNGWIDEAIEDLDKAKQENVTDFIVHQSLGNIYLFQKKNPQKALECYRDAAKYSIESSYYNSYALLHVGAANYFLENFEAAYAAAKEAIEKSPKLVEAYYQLARYCSKLGRYEEALNNLKLVIEADRKYCAKILLEKDFEPMIKQIRDLFENLTNEKQAKAKEEIDKAHNLLSEFNSVTPLDTPKEILNEAENLKRKSTYIDCRDAIYKTYIAEKIAVDNLIQFLSDQELQLKRALNEKKNAVNHQSRQNFEKYTKNHTKTVLASLILAGVSYFYLRIYIDSTLGWVWTVVGLIFPVLYVFDIIRHSFDVRKEAQSNTKINDELEILAEKLNQNASILSRIKIAKQKLSLDELFMGLKNTDYEGFLVKKYG